MTAPFQLTGCRLSGSRLLSGPPNTYDELYALAGQVPAFDLRFDRGSIVDVINGIRPTFARPSSTKLVWNGSQFVSVAADVPAFQVDPLTERLGYLHEPSATNLAWRSAELSSAPWGDQGTAPTVTADQIIAPDGTLTGDRIVFAAADSRRIQGGLSLTAGTVYTASVFARSAGATLNGFRLGIFDGGQQNSSDFAAVPTQWTRFVFTFTAATTVAGTFQLRNTVSPVANDLYFWGAQLETGPVTSPIITPGSAVTRAADTMTVSGVPFSSFYNQLGGVAYAEFSRTAFTTARFPQVFKFRNGGDTDNYETFMLDYANRFALGVRSGGTSQVAFNQSADAAAGSIHRIAARLEVNNALLSLNGATSGLDTSVALPVGMDRLDVGGNALGQLLLHRLTYFPPGPAQSRLQQMTL